MRPVQETYNVEVNVGAAVATICPINIDSFVLAVGVPVRWAIDVDVCELRLGRRLELRLGRRLARRLGRRLAVRGNDDTV